MRYWFDTVKKHINSFVNPTSEFKLLEVGLYHAGNTKQLLEQYPNIQLTGVDPSYHSNIGELQKGYPNFTFINDTSLNVLDRLDGFDVVLIDGDHNRYTVYNELKTIFIDYETFPLVILHDIHKPWGRKDFSYNSNTIPGGEFHREPQGVLSGIEQFINEYTSDDNKDWFKLTLYNLGPGLGILEKMDDKI
jgi:hypothetical protein